MSSTGGAERARPGHHPTDGSAELWLDPEGNTVFRSPCTLRIQANAIDYTWSHEDQDQQGRLTVEASGATWRDSWHQPEPAACAHVPDATGLFTVQHTYGPGWCWRTTLSERPDGNIVLQMTNLAPGGEDGRAVRMVFTPDGASAK
jgi:hypothetical protein